MKQRKKIINLAIHIFVWICFFSLPAIFSTKPKDIPAEITTYMVTLFIVTNLFLLVFYYINTIVLIPHFLFKKKWIVYIISVSCCFVAFIYSPKEITHFVNGTSEEDIRNQIRQEFKQRNNNNLADSLDTKNKLKESKRKPQNNALRYFPGSFVVFLLILTIGICISVFQQWLIAERKKEKIELEKINTELSFLKTQVNPHFFFNTLNNIYSLAVTQSDKTAEAVLKLSAIMRYILTETQTDKVPLENEIEFLKNYIDLQLVRLTDKVQVNFTVNGNASNKNIAPLLFIPFVENAFKYGVSTKENSIINIQLDAANNQVELNINNTIIQRPNNNENTTGIGINNVKRRLALSYHNLHTLTVDDSNQIYKVKLQITLS